MRIQEVRSGIRRIELEMPLLKILKLKCNVWALQTKSGISLFDCGHEEAIGTLQSVLKNQRINQVFLTHGHADHAGSGKHWLKQGVSVYAPRDDIVMLCSEGPESVPRAFRYPGFEPTGIVSVGDKIDLGGDFRFIVIGTPGHTPGSVCYYDEQNNILICGDLLFGPFWGHIVTFTTEFLTALRQTRADLHCHIDSLEQMVKDHVIKNTTLLLPGHGPGFYLRGESNAIKRSLRLLHLCLRL